MVTQETECVNILPAEEPRENQVADDAAATRGGCCARRSQGRRSRKRELLPRCERWRRRRDPTWRSGDLPRAESPMTSSSVPSAIRSQGRADRRRCAELAE
jgi:hypothetical protein